MSFTVYVDADGCPNDVRDIVVRAATKRSFTTVIVANRFLPKPKTKWVQVVQVGSGLDVADAWIAEQATEGDLVVTNDVPLAAEIVEKGAKALTWRGDLLDATNVGERLAMRDFFTEARASGMIEGGGPPPFDKKARASFANAFDRWLTRAQRESG